MQLTSFITLVASVLFINAASCAPLQKRGHSGDATFYTPGLGSCGKTNSESDLVVALSSSVMSKEKCGSSITIKGKTGSVTVKVVDTCPGCGANDIDLSPAAFKQIGSLDAGRIAVTWS